MPRPLRALLDDVEVTLAFYGSIVYLAVVAAFETHRDAVGPAAAISAVIATAIVLYVAHVFAALVPAVARAGRLDARDLRRGLRHDLPLLGSVVVPVVPLALALLGVVDDFAAYELSVLFTMAMLFVLAVSLGRREGLPLPRALAAGAVIIVVMVVVIVLETRVH